MAVTKPMLYVRTVACADLDLKEFTAQWKELGLDGQSTMRQWAAEEMDVLGLEHE